MVPYLLFSSQVFGCEKVYRDLSSESRNFLLFTYYYLFAFIGIMAYITRTEPLCLSKIFT